ncbi:amidohydrolase [Actinomycetospora callitridis]|uniref:amidohydrolase n=1 Tax=Actinomycetospora callitridis TaxID=913944 RepID=UPI002366711D|nr:amidohydrolase [Actinomycetospora callitridis]MDD7916493.1 amidohydrolase [Actinomycetospora callitridis]
MTLAQPRPVTAPVADLGAGHGPEWIDRWLAAHADDVVSWRRAIHARPELARREHETTRLVAETLVAAGLRPRLLPGTGLVCDIGEGPRTVALRADIDALPLTEQTEVPWASQVPGVAHMCGHDAHTAMVLGAGLALAASPEELPGRVRLIFQPAEEVQPGGALDVIAADGLDGVDRIFALHCDPRLEVGKVGTRTGAITSACDMLELRLTSPGGHTSRPHLTADLVHALGTVITGLPDLLSRRVDPRSGTVLVWGTVQAGNATNAVPQQGMLGGTLRTAQHATWNELEPLVRSLVTALLAPTGVGYVLEHRRGVPPVVNDAVSADLLARAAERAVGLDAAVGTEQSSGGEDFGWYLEHVPGAMGRLGVWSGSGDMSDLHQPTFDLDERALPVGVRTLAHAALATLAG